MKDSSVNIRCGMNLAFEFDTGAGSHLERGRGDDVITGDMGADINRKTIAVGFPPCPDLCLESAVRPDSLMLTPLGA